MGATCRGALVFVTIDGARVTSTSHAADSALASHDSAHVLPAGAATSSNAIITTQNRIWRRAVYLDLGAAA
jgi:hypothetical protein